MVVRCQELKVEEASSSNAKKVEVSGRCRKQTWLKRLEVAGRNPHFPFWLDPIYNRMVFNLFLSKYWNFTMPCHIKYKRFTHLFEICDVGNQKTKLWNDKDIFRSLDPAGTCPPGFDGLRCGCHSLLLWMDLVPFQLLSYFSPIYFYHISVQYTICTIWI